MAPRRQTGRAARSGPTAPAHGPLTRSSPGTGRVGPRRGDARRSAGRGSKCFGREPGRTENAFLFKENSGCTGVDLAVDVVERQPVEEAGPAGG